MTKETKMRRNKTPSKKKNRLDLGTFDEDEDDENTVPHESLTWRGDPNDTLSDWTIVVEGIDRDDSVPTVPAAEGAAASSAGHDRDENNPTGIIGTYHVHKGVLAAGTWRSTYFETLFKNRSSAGGAFRENATHTSTVRLEPLAVAAVPTMLDHVYFGTTTFDISSSSSDDDKEETDGCSRVALRWLARYFGIRTLYTAATAAVHRELTIGTAVRYLEESTVFRDDKIVEAVVSVCAEGIVRLTDDHWRAFSPTVFRDVVLRSVAGKEGESVGTDEEEEEGGYGLTRIVARYCRLHPDVVDGEYLASITGEDTLPAIAPDECLYLLGLCLDHDECGGGGFGGSSTDGVDGGAGGAGETGRPATLMERSIRLCHSSWEEVLSATPLLNSSSATAYEETEEDSDDGPPNPPHVRDYYSGFPDETKVTILEGALQTAKGELDDARRRIKDLYVDVGSEKEAVRKLKATLDFTTKYLKDGSGLDKGGKKRKEKKRHR